MTMATNMNSVMNLAAKTAGILCLTAVVTLLTANAPAAAQSRAADNAAAQTSRPRVVIQPRRHRLGPNAKRVCRTRLVQEYRVSGPVIVPSTFCRWQ